MNRSERALKAGRTPLPAGTASSLLIGPALVFAGAAVLWRSGHRRLPGAAATVAAVYVLALTTSPRLRLLIHRILAPINSMAAAVLGFLFLAPLYYFVVTPLGVILRLVGRAPLDTVSDSSRSSYWTVRRDGQDRTPARMYTDERGWQSVGFSRKQRRRLAVGTAVALLLVQGLVIGTFVLVRRRSAPKPGTTVVAFPGASKSASMRSSAWADEAFKETSKLVEGVVYTPFTGSSLLDFHSRYVNVESRVRKSYEMRPAGSGQPLEIWFFGGSTMFGFDLQRDLHTIPSEFVRLAERAGIAVHVRNYGAPGYVNYQETILLSLLVTGQKAPDLVVFYDGINDKAMAMLNAIGRLNPQGEPGELGALQQRRAHAGSGETGNRSATPPAGLGMGRAEKPVTLKRLVADTITVYSQGRDLSLTLAQRYGFQVAHFWQPDLYSKAPLDAGEEALLKSLGLDAFRLEAMSRFGASVRDALPAGVIDISDALNRLRGPVLSDLVHTNEAGAQAVSEAMFENLRPMIESMAASSQ